MTGIDTSVLLRHVLDDDPPQSRTADRFLSRLTADDPGFVSLVVLAEFVWVLRRPGTLSREEVAAVLRELVHSVEIRLQMHREVEEALAASEAGGPGFADHLVAALTRADGVDAVVTFDRAASRLPGRRLLR